MTPAIAWAEPLNKGVPAQHTCQVNHILSDAVLDWWRLIDAAGLSDMDCCQQWDAKGMAVLSVSSQFLRNDLMAHPMACEALMAAEGVKHCVPQAAT